MPFRPKVMAGEAPIPMVEGTDDLELPDDLSILADALRSDADRLADCYPADTAARTRVGAAERPAGHSDHRSSPPFRWSSRWSGAMGGLLAAGLTIAVGWSLASLLQPAHRATVDRNVPRVAPRSVSTRSEDPATPKRQQGDVPTSTGHSATPALFLQELSGPELEGLLDLLDGDAPEGGARETSEISI